MHDALKLLYDRFYTPLPMMDPEQEIESCHHQIIEQLEKPERKLVLRIMDTQNLMAEEHATDSFLSGFHLALEMANELNYNYYKQEAVGIQHTSPVRYHFLQDVIKLLECCDLWIAATPNDADHNKQNYPCP